MYYEKIQGWFNEGQKKLYEKFVSNSSEKNETNILEIGCFLGRSSFFMAEIVKKSNKNIKFHCVDYFQIRDDWPKNSNQKQDLINKFGYDLLPQFQTHIDKLDVSDIVIPYKMSSNDALEYFKKNNMKFDYIFIDGGHAYEIVKNDIIKSLELLKPSGIISGDDYFTSKKNDSVQKAVDELFGNRTTFYNNNSWIIDPDNKLKL